jgi:hypothetical protein
MQGNQMVKSSKRKASKVSNEDIWIGMAEVKPSSKCEYLGDAVGAFTNVVGYAKNRSDFRLKAENLVESLFMKLVRLEDAEPVAQRLRRSSLDKELAKMVKLAAKKPGSIQYSTFDSWNTE